MSPFTTVGELVAKDIRKADVLRRHGIDYCCGGKKTLEAACREKGVNMAQLAQELEACTREAGGVQPDFDSMSLSFLSDFIEQIHHRYVKNTLPVLDELSAKVAHRHGGDQPHLHTIRTLVEELAWEMLSHMKKEEQILFPAIKALEKGASPEMPFRSISDPIAVMEDEHDTAGQLMTQIRQVANDYQPPAHACNSYRMLYFKLEEFEKDLFRHVHLENNILFPKAEHLGTAGQACAL